MRPRVRSAPGEEKRAHRAHVSYAHENEHAPDLGRGWYAGGLTATRMGSSSEIRESLAGGLPERLVREQLKRITSSEIFSRSERLGAFLRFVVIEALEGRGDSLKEQVLAAELYGKRSGSNTSDDATVRTDARRLRDKLREYYAQFPHEPVIIELPKGGYVPVFERNTAASVPTVVPIVEAKPENVGLLPPRSRSRQVVMVAAGLAAFAVAVAFWLRHQPAGEVWRPVHVSVLPGEEGSPSLSPDGNLVAFAWTGSAEAGQTDIYVKAVDGETVRRITDTPASETGPAWSPDGDQIAFFRRGEGVFIISQLGGSERKISETGTIPGWTPDGKSVLIRDWVGDRPPAIFQVSVETLERRQLTQPLSGYGDWRFDVSRDGETLAFIRSSRLGVSDIYVVPMSGGNPERRTNWNAAMGGVLWAPDGRDLIFNVGYGYPLSLRRVPARGVRPERGYPVVLPVPANSPSISRPRPGEPARLAFLKVYHDISLRLVELDTRASRDVIRTVRPLCDSTIVDYPGNFSPDGKWVAFTSQRSAKPKRPFLDGGQLWVASTGCNDLRQITAIDAPSLRHPSWSPDATQIAFGASIDGNSDIYIVGAHGGKPRRLTVEPSIETFPYWSLHSGKVYFSSDRTGRWEIWRVPAEGGAAEQITRNGGFEPIESMDGKFIFYVMPGQASKLKRIAVDGSDDTLILERILPAHWAVTERGIFFISRERESDAIDLYHPDNGKVSRVGLLPFRVATIGDIGRFTVSRDGRWALTHKIERWDSDIMMIDNFR